MEEIFIVGSSTRVGEQPHNRDTSSIDSNHKSCQNQITFANIESSINENSVTMLNQEGKCSWRGKNNINGWIEVNFLEELIFKHGNYVLYCIT
jgi:hypothetical protein